MVILGVDAHKHTHTVVAVDDNGRQVASRTVGTSTNEHLGLLRWATQFGNDTGGRPLGIGAMPPLLARPPGGRPPAGGQILRGAPKLPAPSRPASPASRRTTRSRAPGAAARA